MTVEQFKEQHPETFKTVFSLGVNVGKKLQASAQNGILPEPGTNPEFDQLNQSIDKALNN